MIGNKRTDRRADRRTSRRTGVQTDGRTDSVSTGRLSRTRIVEKALVLVENDGMEALTMRKLGAALGVDPMAVYYYVPNKQALIEALVEHVFSDFSPPMDNENWQASVRNWARAYRGLAMQYRHLVLQVVTHDKAVAAAAARLADPGLFDAIRASGLSKELARTAADTVVDFVHGFVLGEAALSEEVVARFEGGLDILIAGINVMAERDGTTAAALT